MGDLSSEPSMEEILSSIKRIIAEEGEAAPGRTRRGGRTVQAQGGEGDEVLELSDPMPVERGVAERASAERVVAAVAPRPERVASPRKTDPIEEKLPAATITAEAEGVVSPVPPPADPQAVAAKPMVSPGTVEATRGALDHLSRMLVKPEPGTDGTLEGLIREMIRPMLREWLDAHLPALAEEMVAREIGRITSGRV